MSRLFIPLWGVFCVVSCSFLGADASAQSATSPEDVQQAMKKAATYYFETVSTHGGYVYHYSPDLKIR